MQHARATLRKIFSDALRREGGDAPLLAWPLACGAKIAAKTNAIGFADGVLTVAVPDGTWRLQLQSFAPQYLAALNQVNSQPVKQINFVTANQPER